jgi:predicted Zn-dependent protease with MMP-like domain
VLYRRPLETRAQDSGDLSDLVHEVLVEQIASYLGVDPDAIDGPTDPRS